MPPRHPGPPDAHDHEERIRAAHAKADMLRLGHSLTRAAADNAVRPSAVVRWFGESIVRRNGRYVALPDAERFLMTVVTTAGVLELEVQGSHDRSQVGRHHGAIGQLLDPDIGDPGPLMALRGTRVAGHELEADPETIEQLWLEEELDFISLYVLDA